MDALDEFKLQPSTYSAEFGRSLGGVVNLGIKSGTDGYSWCFEFHQNDAFDANNFYADQFSTSAMCSPTVGSSST